MRKPLLLLFACFAFLTACQEEILYSQRTEDEANEMLFALRQVGIDASKETAKDGSITVMVEKDRFFEAVRVLQAAGLPKHKKLSTLDLFPADGMFSTPTQEGVRLKYALEQELAQSLLLINGVRDARVHLVLPERVSRTETKQPSASVILMHDDGLDEIGLVPRVQHFLENGVEGLSRDRISVVLFPVDGPAPQISAIQQ